jgi:hypothetical protein
LVSHLVVENYGIFFIFEVMKIGVIIPDRGDREKFLQNCIRMIEAQTIDQSMLTVKIIDYKPLSDAVDITQRYRIGYDYFRNGGFDCILLMENDDYYSPNYIQTMIDKWIELGKPDLIGTNYTIYYHINERAHFTMNHSRRASAMNTLIKSDLNFNWCVDHEPYTDLHLWKTLQGVTFYPGEIISIGIKHGVGKCGGRNHVDYLHRYINKDPNSEFLSTHMDQESFNFYTHEIFQD